MKTTIMQPVEIEIEYFYMNIPIFLEDLTFNHNEVTLENKNNIYGLFESNEQTRLKFFINIDTGEILEWPKGNTLSIYAKVRDEGIYSLIDNNGNSIKNIEYEYVPDGLDIEEEGYGDYVIFNVNSEGIIENFNGEQIVNWVLNINEED